MSPLLRTSSAKGETREFAAFRDPRAASVGCSLPVCPTRFHSSRLKNARQPRETLTLPHVGNAPFAKVCWKRKRKRAGLRCDASIKLPQRDARAFLPHLGFPFRERRASKFCFFVFFPPSLFPSLTDPGSRRTLTGSQTTSSAWPCSRRGDQSAEHNRKSSCR